MQRLAVPLMRRSCVYPVSSLMTFQSRNFNGLKDFASSGNQFEKYPGFKDEWNVRSISDLIIDLQISNTLLWDMFAEIDSELRAMKRTVRGDSSGKSKEE